MLAKSQNELHWYLVQANLDGALREMFNRHGFEYYQPVRRVMRAIPRHKLSPSQRKHPTAVLKPVLEVLWPTYLFVRTDPANSMWDKIRGNQGICGIYVNGNRVPAQCPDDMVDNLRGLEVDGAIPSNLSIQEFAFSVGQKVKITTGAFAGLEGTIKDVDKKRGYDLLIYLLGGDTVVSGFAETDLKELAG